MLRPLTMLKGDATMKLPNNYGTVDKLPGKRRRPYRARKPVNGERVTIGYFSTKEDALRSLANANADIIVQDGAVTVDDIYELWKAEYQIGKPYPKEYENAYGYLYALKHRKIADLRAIDLETVINMGNIPKSVKTRSIVVLHGIFGYALRHEIISKDYSHIARFITDNSTTIVRKVFTSEEINELWKVYGRREKIILVLLYTGMRISELLSMRKKDVHLNDGYMVGGLKTEAGKNRIIPIHSTIHLLVKAQLSEVGDYLFSTRSGKPISRQNFLKEMKNIGHTPHDTRHTFITRCHQCGILETDIRRIVGHSQKGVTQSVYTHPDTEYLSNEIEKLFY